MRCVDPLGEKMAKIWLKLQENGEKKSQIAKMMAKEKYILARTLPIPVALAIRTTVGPITPLIGTTVVWITPLIGTTVVRIASAITDTYTALLYELAFTATRSVSGYCCKLSNVELG